MSGPTIKGWITLHHMDSLVKQLELRVYGVRIAANADAQAEREELYRMAE